MRYDAIINSLDMTGFTIKPFPYVGGKSYRIRKDILRLIEHTPHRIYVEPFCGSATIFFLKRRRAPIEVLGDIDYRVINTLRDIRDASDTITRLLTVSLYDSLLYRIAKDIDDGGVVGSWAFMYVAGQVFRGKQGGSYYWKPDNTIAYKARDIAGFARLLRGAVLEQRDALDVIAEYDSPDTLFFFDPPYINTTVPYAPEARDAVRVNERLRAVLPALRGKFILTHYEPSPYDDLAVRKIRVEQRRSIQLTGDNYVIEAIYTNI